MSFESTLSSPDGTVSDNLRDKMPKRAGAEAKAKQAWELIHQQESYSKREQIPKTLARAPGTSLPGHSLTHSSLLHWFATTCHVPLFDLFQPFTFLKWQLPPVDTHQDTLCRLFTPCPPFSATVVLYYQFVRNKALSGVLLHLVNGSHPHLGAIGDIFDRGCNQDSHI